MIAVIFWGLVFLMAGVMFPFYLIHEVKANKKFREEQLELLKRAEFQERPQHQADAETIAFYESEIAQMSELLQMYQDEMVRTTDSNRLRTLTSLCTSLEKQLSGTRQKLLRLKRGI